jgi:hypothetical protein
MADSVFPILPMPTPLPYAEQFFDAIVSIDAYRTSAPMTSTCLPSASS